MNLLRSQERSVFPISCNSQRPSEGHSWTLLFRKKGRSTKRHIRVSEPPSRFEGGINLWGVRFVYSAGVIAHVSTCPLVWSLTRHGYTRHDQGIILENTGECPGICCKNIDCHWFTTDVDVNYGWCWNFGQKKHGVLIASRFLRHHL